MSDLVGEMRAAGFSELIRDVSAHIPGNLSLTRDVELSATVRATSA